MITPGLIFGGRLFSVHTWTCCTGADGDVIAVRLCFSRWVLGRKIIALSEVPAIFLVAPLGPVPERRKSALFVMFRRPCAFGHDLTELRSSGAVDRALSAGHRRASAFRVPGVEHRHRNNSSAALRPPRPSPPGPEKLPGRRQVRGFPATGFVYGDLYARHEVAPLTDSYQATDQPRQAHRRRWRPVRGRPRPTKLKAASDLHVVASRCRPPPMPALPGQYRAQGHHVRNNRVAIFQRLSTSGSPQAGWSTGALPPASRALRRSSSGCTRKLGGTRTRARPAAGQNTAERAGLRHCRAPDDRITSTLSRFDRRRSVAVRRRRASGGAGCRRIQHPRESRDE